MRKQQPRAGRWLAAIVVAHLGVSIVHGLAHVEANVALPRAAMLFVWIVILVGPLVGLAWRRFSPARGAWVVAATMSAALMFGLVNHFLIEGPDHVHHVTGAWRAVFGATAGLLFLTEAIGSSLGVWYAAGSRRSL